MKRVVIAAVLIAGGLFGSRASAQCLPAPGTGCMGFPNVKDCVTNPSIGQPFCLASVPCPAGCGPVQLNLFFLGPPMPVPFAAPTCCSAPPCRLYSPPGNIFMTDQRPPGMQCIPIPPNPALVGLNFGIQPVCVDPASGCFDLAPALVVRIRP